MVARRTKALAAALLSATCACDAGDAASPPPSRGDGGTYLTTVTSRRVRRLSRREYDNAVRDLLGDTSDPAASFGPEVYVNGYDNGSEGLTVQGSALDAFQAAAEAVAARAVAGSVGSLIGDCDALAPPAACVATFLLTFPAKAYRRPPTPAELQRLQAVYDFGASGGDVLRGIRLTLEAILQSPAFLYRQELGAPDPTLPAGYVQLGPYEVAEELSFLLIGSIPDAELTYAAANGKLATPADRRREALRLLGQPAAKAALRAFLHQWLSTGTLASTPKDPSVYPFFSPSVATSMAGELDRYFDQVLWAGSGSLRELFTSRVGFVDDNLALFYGVSSPPAGGDYRRVDLDEATRRGVLTRLGFLTSHADADNSGPVARGVFVLDSLLCTPPAPPPPNVPALPPASAAAIAHQTTRQRFDAHLSNPTCRGCHATIDGIGFGFEQFDGTGAYRTVDNGSPVDTSGVLHGTDVDGPFAGVTALEDKLLGSRELRACFLKQLVRYETGKADVDPGVHGALHDVEQSFSVDTRVVDAIVTLVTEPAFVVRSTRQTTF